MVDEKKNCLHLLYACWRLKFHQFNVLCLTSPPPYSVPWSCEISRLWHMVAYVSRRISGCRFSPPKITAGETRAAKTGCSRRLDTWTPLRKRYTCNFVGKIKAALKIDLLGKGLIRGIEIEAPIHALLIWPANYGHKRRDFPILKDRRNIVKCRLSSAGLLHFRNRGFFFGKQQAPDKQ